MPPHAVRKMPQAMSPLTNSAIAPGTQTRAVPPKGTTDRMAPADGAFYLYADISRFTDDAAGFCQRMLAETGIAATPGFDFDRRRGHYFMRFSFAGATDRMIEAARRLKAWTK